MSKQLSIKERQTVVRDIFESIAAIGFLTWRQQHRHDFETLLAELTLDRLRESYVIEFEKIAWTEIKQMAENATDERLLDVRQEWIDRADAAGLLQWRQDKNSQAKKPWPQLIGEAIASEALFPKGDNKPTAELRRWATDDLMRAIVLDVSPHKATREMFGIRTQEHLEAIYEPVRHGEITRQQLHDAVGDGANLTAMVNAARTNPHLGIEFITRGEGKETPAANTAPHRHKDIELDR
jgi:hypothetical protein